MDSTTHRRTVVALTAIALLALPNTAVSAAKDYEKNAPTSAYAHGPLPPSDPAKDYDKNAATGDYSGRRSTERPEAAPSTEPVSPSPAQIVTVAAPSGFDWSDAAIGAGVALAIGALGLTTVVRRRRIVSPAAAGRRGVTR